jgi:hypothetical protein
MVDLVKTLNDTSIPVGGDPEPLKKSFFHQFVGFQISKNPHLLIFAKQNLISTHPRSIYKVEFGGPGEWFITYDPEEDPVKYDVFLSHTFTVSDVSFSNKYQCYFNYITNAPFVIDADLITLIYLASLHDMNIEVLGEWMRSATKGRYTGFNPVHLF